MAELRIPGVPAAIERSKWIEMLAGLGLSARDLREFEATPAGIKATVHVRDDAGKHVIEDDRIATHQVFIRLI